MSKKRVMFIGRWSPFHSGHKYLIDSYINAGEKILILVRDSSEKYDSIERMFMIRKVYPDRELVKILIIPDIKIVITGRSVGYGIAKMPEEIEAISGTKIRSGESKAVPKEVEEFLK